MTMDCQPKNIQITGKVKIHSTVLGWQGEDWLVLLQMLRISLMTFNLLYALCAANLAFICSIACSC